MIQVKKKYFKFLLLTGLCFIGAKVFAHPSDTHGMLLPLPNPYDYPDPEPMSFFSATWKYLVLGFEHILPKGLDHILFVLGMFLLSKNLKTLIWQISIFTVAHSVTLALSINKIVSIPGHIVEPLIALSIVFIAVENIFTSKLNAWRPIIILIFGLLHGLGFAGVLSELGLPKEQFVTALVAFNFGVEIGQLTVIAMAFLLVKKFREQTWYRSRIVRPSSSVIACIGMFWVIERVYF